MPVLGGVWVIVDIDVEILRQDGVGVEWPLVNVECVEGQGFSAHVGCKIFELSPRQSAVSSLESWPDSESLGAEVGQHWSSPQLP